MNVVSNSFGLAVLYIYAISLINNVTPSIIFNETLIRNPRILNGSPVSIYDARYIASIRVKTLEIQKGYGYGHVCTGAVISQRVVLTAAVCRYNGTAYVETVLNTHDFTVVMGSIYLYEKDAYTIQYDVQSFISHPNFNYSSYSPLYDIALMFMNGYIPWNHPTIAAIALNTKEVAENTECQVTGWGQPPADIPVVKGLLLQVEVPIISETQCAIFYNGNSTAMFYAGFKNFSGVDACDGDSGAPLTCNGLLTGDANWDNGCLPLASVGKYTNVSDFSNWIIQTNGTFNYSKYGNGAKVDRGSRFWTVTSIIISVIISLFLK